MKHYLTILFVLFAATASAQTTARLPKDMQVKYAVDLVKNKFGIPIYTASDVDVDRKLDAEIHLTESDSPLDALRKIFPTGHTFEALNGDKAILIGRTPIGADIPANAALQPYEPPAMVYDRTMPDAFDRTPPPAPVYTSGRIFGGTGSRYARSYDPYYRYSGRYAGTYLGSWEYQDWRAAIASGEYGLVGFNCDRSICEDVIFYLDGCEAGTVTQANNFHDGKIPVSRGQHRITLAKNIDGMVHALHIETNVGAQAISQAIRGEKFLNIRVSKDRFNQDVWGNVEVGWVPPSSPSCGR